VSRYYVGAALFVAGLALRAWGTYHLLKHSGLRLPFVWHVVPPVTVVKSGPYRFLRHPLYVGAMTWMAGAGIFALGWGGVVLPLAAWPFYAERMLREEAMCDGVPAQE
jgi:protein-S-isoprenylcysteine O-methyltransferase Ste14